MKRTVKTLALGFALVLGLALFVSGNVDASLADQQKEAEQNIADFKKEIEKLEGQIFETIARLEQVEASIRSAEVRVAQLEQDLAVKEVELQEATVKFNIQREEFYQNMRTKYEDGDVEYASVILDSANLTEIINYNEYYRIMKTQEEAKIQLIKNAKAAIEGQKAAIEKNKNDTVNEKNNLAVEKDKLDAVKKTYTANKAALQKQLAAEEADRAAILQEIANLNRYVGGPYTGNGQLQWPVPSIPSSTTNVSGFMTPERPTHKGFDIGGYGVSGRTVVACDGGEVILAKSYSGYGNAIIIDHNNGMVTLYGHLASFNVSVGQKVSRGQVIGIMGNTGQSSGIHLHVEVIINGSNVDPEPFIR